MYLWAMRDKRSEWSTVRSLLNSSTHPFSLLVESVCEPFVSIRDSRIQTPDEVVAKLAERISTVSLAVRVSVDLGNLKMVHSDRVIAGMLTSLSTRLGTNARSVVPVIRTDSAPEVFGAALSWTRTFGTGLCIRALGLTRLDVASRAVQAILDETNLFPEQLDLITDAQDLPRIVTHSEMRAAFPQTANARSWSHLAGSFPSSITHLKADGYEHTLERSEWSVWIDEVSKTDVGRVPDYADYATQSPTYNLSPGFGGSPTVRYSTDSDFVVLRGRGGTSNKPADFSQYIGHARYLKRAPYYRSQVDTLGDDYIDWIATGMNKTGNLETWRVASFQRHVTLAASQVGAMQPIVHRRNAVVGVDRQRARMETPSATKT